MFLQSFSRNQCLLLHARVKSRPFKKILPSTILLYTPENWHDNETTTIKKDVSPIRKDDFPASHVSFLKNTCNNYAQLKRHYGTAPCRSSSTKKQTTLLTWGCRPHFVVSLPSRRTKKQHGRVWHQVLTYWRERTFMIKHAEFWYISEIWLFLFQSDKRTSMSHHILHHLERENPSISLVLSHDLMISAVYIFSAFISQQHWKQKTKKSALTENQQIRLLVVHPIYTCTETLHYLHLFIILSFCS